LKTRHEIAAGLLALSLLTERFFSSYAASWILGSLAAAYIAIRGDALARLSALSLLLLASLPGAQSGEGLRYCVFFCLFLAISRHVKLSPTVHLVLQVGMLSAALLTQAVAAERFVFGTSVLLTLRAVTTWREPEPVRSLSRAVRGGLYAMGSLASAAIGYGSRSALFVWFVVLARRHAIAGGIVTVVALSVTISLPELPIISKARTSLAEVLEPVDQATGGASLRGVEYEVFADYLKHASVLELALGSREEVTLPGAPFGRDADLRYIPHNQLFGIFFQFGAIGTLIVALNVLVLYRSYKPSPVIASFVLGVLAPGFLLKHGFLDTDLPLLFATFNWLARENA
jgi:hypothetical protein